MDYELRCREAADAQGITAISNALTSVGIENQIEQTGGFTMVCYVYGKDDNATRPVTDPPSEWWVPRIGIVADTVALEFEDENDADAEILLTHEGCIHGEDGRLPQACLNEIIVAVVMNMPRINDNYMMTITETTIEELAASQIVKMMIDFKETKANYLDFLLYIHTWIDDEIIKESAL